MTSKEEFLTAEALRELLAYDPETGEFVWLKSPRNSVPKGAVAGSLNGRGYTCITALGKVYRAHRLAWLHVYGSWPADDIDHINGEPTDNRIANLREATRSQNQANSRIRKDNSSGSKGVIWERRRQKWEAQIRVNGKRRHLGYFTCKEEAARAYAAAAKQAFGEFARLA
jgi:hypothetical protein